MSDEKQDRAKHVAQMLANSRLEGLEPDEHQQQLLQQYIEGTTTLNDLLQDARQFALIQQLEESTARARIAYEKLHREYQESNAQPEKQEPANPVVTALVDGFWADYRP
jgi:hypothetical protein